MLRAMLGVSLLFFGISANATPITLSISGNIDESIGTKIAGSSYSFSWLFDDSQTPITTQSDRKLYSLDSLTLTVGSDVVTSNGGTIAVVNDRTLAGDQYGLRSEGSSVGFTGSIGGVSVN